jgi:NADPH:quinone reductase-like Zn-dependent oxidoreductase
MPAIPTMMRAAAIERFGGPEVLKLREMPVPEIGTREALIAVHTAGVGTWDAEMRAGWWPSGRPRFPLVLGSDGSGTVAKVGSRVRGFKPGDRVYAYSFANEKGGFYAEYVAVVAPSVGHLPQRLNLKEAGAIGTTGLTALQGVERLGVRKHQPIIIVGAAGGVGSLAVQFALRWLEAHVLAVVKGKDAVKLVRGLGARFVVDSLKDDVGAEASKFAPDGVMAVLAFVGGETLDECIAQIRTGGRLVNPNGIEPAPRKRRGLEIVAYDAEPGIAQFKRLNRAIEETKLKVPISAEFPLAQAKKAHQRIESGHVLGKIVLRIR